MGVSLARQVVPPIGVPLPISKGGTGEITAPAALNALLPDQIGQAGKGLYTDGIVVSWQPINTIGAVLPGVDKQIIFNDSGNFGASTLLFDKNENTLTVNGNILPDGTVNIGTSVNRINDLHLSKGAYLTAISETVLNGGNTGTNIIAPDASLGTVYQYLVTGDFTLSTLANVVPGTVMTVILIQDNTGGHVLTSTMLFPNGNGSLSVEPNTTDIMSIVYDGVNYYAVISKKYGGAGVPIYEPTPTPTQTPTPTPTHTPTPTP